MEDQKKVLRSISPRVQLSIAGTVFLIILIGYIVQVNASSTKAYALRDATRVHEELLRSQDRTIAELDRIRSLSSIMERAAFLDLVPVERIAYIQSISQHTFAIK